MSAVRCMCFDIECCDGRTLCEFGYVITDDCFNILEKKVFVINPEKEFRLTGRDGESDIQLFFSKEEYLKGKPFPEYYERIKELLCKEHQIVIGYSVSNDAEFLRTACKRYKLPPIDFHFFDAQKAYADYIKDGKQISLEKAGNALQIKMPAVLHKSDEDAHLAIQIIQKICEESSVSLFELKKRIVIANGRSKGFRIAYRGNSLFDVLEMLSKDEKSISTKKRNLCVIRFAEEVKPKGNIIKSALLGKRLCFSADFEREHTKDSLVLIQLLADRGCGYSTMLSKDSYYVATQEELASKEVKERTRYSFALHNNYRIISFSKLYRLLSVTEDEVKRMPMPKVEKRVYLPLNETLKRKTKNKKVQ